MTPMRILAVLLCLVVAAPAALADGAKDKAQREAEKHFRKAEKLFALGRFDEALVYYEKAFEAKPLPHFLFNIGQCHRNLGHVDEAIFSYRKYLKLWPDAPNREAVEELIDDLEDQRTAERERRKRERERERDAELTTPPPPPGGGDDRRTDDGGIHTKWWFWTGVAVVAGGVTAAVVLSSDDAPGVPSTTLGNIDFPK